MVFTDLAIERVDELTDGDPPPDIADLWVRDTKDLRHGRCYPLVSEAPNKWVVKGAIQL